jgi:multidrug efflux pump subunit AcrB
MKDNERTAMDFIGFWIRRPAFTLVLTLCVMALGWVSAVRIPRSEDPALKIPVFTVIAVMPGLGPVDLEKLVARPLEDSIQELDDLKKVQSVIRDGLVVTTVEFEYGTDVDRKNDDVLRQVNEVREKLPAGVVRLEVKKVQTIDVSLIQVALVSEAAGYDRLADLAEELERRLETVPGVRRAERWAFPEKEVQVIVDAGRLAKSGIGVGAVAMAMAGDGQTVVGGSAELGDRRFTVKTTGAYGSLEDIRLTPVGLGGVEIGRAHV